MFEYPTAGDLANKYDRDRKIDFLQRMGKKYVKEEIEKVLADDRYQTEQQKQTAARLIVEGYAIDAEDARNVFVSLPRQSSNDQYERKKR